MVYLWGDLITDLKPRILSDSTTHISAQNVCLKSLVIEYSSQQWTQFDKRLVGFVVFFSSQMKNWGDCDFGLWSAVMNT